MEDLFDQSASKPPSDSDDFSAVEWNWAGRVIREVSEQVSQEEKSEKAFLVSWVRWTDMVSFLSYTDLCLHRLAQVTPSQLAWHQTIVSGLIALGSVFREKSAFVAEANLNLVDYSSGKLEAQISMLKESWDLWHGEKTPALADLSNALEHAIEG
ncbi:MAG: hypothetical protein AAF555_06575 [Verrucomicrobiota bacterium]